jgi:glycosyltransferase involved in cell wall biosynthesis
MNTNDPVTPATDRPRVTVAIPTYKRPEMLAEALESVLGGTYQDFEVLVANDDPTDDLASLQARFGDPRIRWLARPENIGMLDNHLDAFRHARGEFIAFLDDDDRWSPGLLSTLVPILDSHPDVVVAFADHYVVDDTGRVDEALSDYVSERWGRAALDEGPHRPFHKIAVVDQSIPLQCAAVLRASAISLADYDRAVGNYWDLWSSYLLARSGGTAWYVPQRLAFYRSHADAATTQGRAANARAGIYVWRQFLADAAVAPWKALIRRRLAASHRALAAEYLQLGSGRDARRHARLAVALDRSPKTIGLALAAHTAPRGSARLAGHTPHSHEDRAV